MHGAGTLFSLLLNNSSHLKFCSLQVRQAETPQLHTHAEYLEADERWRENRRGERSGWGRCKLTGFAFGWTFGAGSDDHVAHIRVAVTASRVGVSWERSRWRRMGGLNVQRLLCIDAAGPQNRALHTHTHSTLTVPLPLQPSALQPNVTTITPQSQRDVVLTESILQVCSSSALQQLSARKGG